MSEFGCILCVCVCVCVCSCMCACMSVIVKRENERDKCINSNTRGQVERRTERQTGEGVT